MEAELIHTMKNHGADASRKLLTQWHQKGLTVHRERFLNMVIHHILENNDVPHVESVLKELDTQPKLDNKISLKF